MTASQQATEKMHGLLGDNASVRIVYTNYRGETATRTVIPQAIWFGSTEWHPHDQWLLDAFDVEKNAQRSFALADIHSWAEVEPVRER